MPASSDRPLRLFVSFAPADRELKDELLKHLAVLQQIGKVEPWSVDAVRPGADWRQEVERALVHADVALLLVSADFLASDFLQDVEVPRLFERRSDGGLVVLPLLLRSCRWDLHPWLSKLRPLPRNSKPLAAHKGDGRDQALAEVVSELAHYAQEKAAIPRRAFKHAVPASTHQLSQQKRDAEPSLEDSAPSVIQAAAPVLPPVPTTPTERTSPLSSQDSGPTDVQTGQVDAPQQPQTTDSPRKPAPRGCRQMLFAIATTVAIFIAGIWAIDHGPLRAYSNYPGIRYALTLTAVLIAYHLFGDGRPIDE